MIKMFSMSDLQKCSDLYVRVFNGEPWNEKWTNDTAHARLLEFVENKRFLGYTLWESDELIGAIFCHVKTFYSGNEIFIEEMWISPDYQRKGCGKLLMDGVEKYAKENGITSIALLTGKDKPAFNFYKKLDYNHLEFLAFMYKHIK